MGDTLVVYYSRTGKTRRVAETLARMLDADIEEIREKKNRSGAPGFLGGVWDALRKRPAELTGGHSTEGRKTVIVGTPVWANRPPPAVRTYLRTVDLTGRNVCAFATHDGGGAKRTFRTIAELLDGPLGETIDFKKPKADDPGVEQRCREWAETVRAIGR